MVPAESALTLPQSGSNSYMPTGKHEEVPVVAYDDANFAYHLTPNGWVSDDDPPIDRVETWNVHIYQASGWSKERRTWSLIWANSDVPATERDKLRVKYGQTPMQKVHNA